jgi:homoserine O-acetyltransferase/O-succinyltransferase
VSDPDWREGNYYGTPGPVKGLSIARMIGHITYISDEHMDTKFGRKFQSADRLSFDFSTEFAVESYLKSQGERFTERFDANSYLYITKAVDYFDLAGSYGCGSIDTAFSQAESSFLVVSYSSDWLFTTAQSRAIVTALVHNRQDVSFVELNAPYGHDAFLLDVGELTRLVAPFLKTITKERR